MDRGEEIELAANAALNGLNRLEGFDETDMLNMFASGVTWADEHAKSVWISVEDDLPPERVNVFFLVEWRAIHKEYHVGWYRNGIWESEQQIYRPNSFLGNVTHWMPIPE